MCGRAVRDLDIAERALAGADAVQEVTEDSAGGLLVGLYHAGQRMMHASCWPPSNESAHRARYYTAHDA